VTSDGAIPLFERTFYFLRHGETESNRLKTIAGSLDVELNEIGRAQALAAIELVRPLGITRVTSSALRRARDTAAVVAGALQLPHVVLPALAERSWGDLEGKPQALRAAGVKAEGAESREQFVARTRSGLVQVQATGTPLVVAHSGTFRVLCRLLGLEEPRDAVANCRPVCFSPPARPGGTWSVDLP
jgi:broad specificity phosphatase PhoE